MKKRTIKFHWKEKGLDAVMFLSVLWTVSQI